MASVCIARIFSVVIAALTLQREAHALRTYRDYRIEASNSFPSTIFDLRSARKLLTKREVNGQLISGDLQIARRGNQTKKRAKIGAIVEATVSPFLIVRWSASYHTKSHRTHVMDSIIARCNTTLLATLESSQ